MLATLEIGRRSVTVSLAVGNNGISDSPVSGISTTQQAVEFGDF